MATFGYTTIGTTGGLTIAAVGWEDISGSVFTCTEFGTATSITVALKRTVAGSDNVKCAIYKHSDLSLLAQTEERNLALTTSYVWYTFTFATPPSLIGGTDYILVVWGDYTAQNITCPYDNGDANQGHKQTLAYGAFPNPLVPSHQNTKASIYCTYTMTGVAIASAANETIAGSIYTFPNQDCNIMNITVSLARTSAGSNNVKCAVYRHDTLALVGTSEEVNCSLTTSFANYTFTMVPGRRILKDVEYILAVWADYTASNIYVAATAGSTNQGHTETKAYGTFSDPLAPTHNDYAYTITPTYHKVSPFFAKVLAQLERASS